VARGFPLLHQHARDVGPSEVLLSSEHTLVDFAGACDVKEIRLHGAFELGVPFSHQRARFGCAEQAVLIQGGALAAEAGERDWALIIPSRYIFAGFPRKDRTVHCRSIFSITHPTCTACHFCWQAHQCGLPSRRRGSAAFHQVIPYRLGHTRILYCAIRDFRSLVWQYRTEHCRSISNHIWRIHQQTPLSEFGRSLCGGSAHGRSA
jgi:hypothetical protein